MRRFSLAALAVVAGLFACSRSGPLGGTDRPEANFAEVVDPEQNLTFTFPDDVVADSLVGRWADSAAAGAVVKLSPAVPGQVRWTDRHTLTFSPRRPFAAATRYAATVRAGGKDADYTFHTPLLQVEGARAYWATSPTVAGAAEARLVLRFNYPVRPQDVQQALTLTTATGKTVAFTVGGAAPSEEITLAVAQLPGAEVEASPVPLVAKLRAGLKSAAGGEATKAATQTATEVPARTTLLISEMTGAYADGMGLLNVFTTQPVITDDVPALVTLDPAVAFTVKALDNGFQLRGDFKAGAAYTVRISGRLRGVFSTTLGQDYTQTVSFGTAPAQVAFADGGRLYLGAAGARNLALTLAGVQRVSISVTKVYESNAQTFFKSGTRYGYDDDASSASGWGSEGGYEDHSFQYYDTRAVGDVLLARTVDVKSLPRDGKHRLLHLSLQDLEFDKPLKGLYVVRVQDTERRWLQASQVVVVSDIGLIARQSRAGLLVFAASVQTAEPLPGVAVTAYSTTNQAVATATTGADGTVLIPATKIGAGLGGFNTNAGFGNDGTPRRYEGESYSDDGDDPTQRGALAETPTTGRFELGLVTARLADDFSLLDLERSRVDVARFDVGGLQANAARYLAFCYGDRDLYRPGDTIRANTLVRDPDTWAPIKGVPLLARLVLPSGRAYQTQRLTLGPDGAAPATFVIPPSVMTGRWSLEVLTANQVLLTSRKLSVEEFLPDRLRLKVDVTKPTLRPGETQTARLTATTLFGPPAADRRYELETSLRRETFAPKGFDDYDFSLAFLQQQTDAFAAFGQQVLNGQTDAAGQVTQTFTVPATLADLGLLMGTAFATVFDEAGRPVNRLATFRVPTQAAFFGVKRFDSWVGTNAPLTVPVVALDVDGHPAPRTPVEMLVVRRVWETVVERQYGRFAYNSQPREQVVYRQAGTTDGAGRTTLSYTPLNSGDYEVRVRRPGAPTWVSAPFYAYGGATATANAFAVNPEGRVEISTDKPRYRVGEKAKLLLKAPFAGRLLVTVERDQVLQHFSLTAASRSASVEIPLTETSRPNVFVTVTAIRAQRPGADNLPLTVARGYQPLIVEAPDAKLPLTLTVAPQTRSRRVLPIRIQTAPHARLTVAVVDEGILQIKDFQTPDPYAYFYQRRALEVLGYDLYPFLFPERGLGPVGGAVGGDAYALAKRVNPLTSKRVRLVSLWSGVLEADGNGRVAYNARIPQFSGAVRVMACAWNGPAFGSAEQEVKVADPVVISTALPRFLSPQDTVLVPVTLTNTTNKPAPATATLALTGPLRALGGATQTTTLPPNAEARVTFRVLAPAGTGIGSATVSVAALGETFRETTEISVRPTAGLTSYAESGTVAGGQAKSFDFSAARFLPGSLTARLTVARTPLARFADDLRYLIQYPYGCLEQTVSAAFPQLYYADLARALGQITASTRFNPAYNVQQAIAKIEAMQQPDGALSYWPGGTETNAWASVYAAHFLTEAQKAGYAVDRAFLDRLLRNLAAQVRARPTAYEPTLDSDPIDPAMGVRHGPMRARREALYALYVLALHQRADATALNYYKANLPLLAFESRHLLAAALAVSGNAPAARTVVPAAFSTAQEARARRLDGDFASPVREEALGLLALLDAAPAHASVPVLAARLSKALASAQWLSTQERAFALLALGRQARADAASTVTATLATGVAALPAFTGAPLTLSRGLAGQTVRVSTAGKGPLYYTQELEGVPADGASAVPLTDENLQVRRRYLTREGIGLPPDHVFRLGELVVVELTLRCPETVSSVPNVAITDLLPAGLEVENPRLGVQRELNLPEPAEPDYLDLRDDRLTYFTTATAQPKTFRYLARAVTAGTYRAAPITAAAMYDATYRSASGGGLVRVVR